VSMRLLVVENNSFMYCVDKFALVIIQSLDENPITF